MQKTQALGLMNFTSLGNSGFFQESSIKVVVMGFIHLHVHSQYSFLDGASSLEGLLDKAVSLKMPALALTDHNRLTGAICFYDKTKAVEINGIVQEKLWTPKVISRQERHGKNAKSNRKL